MKIGIQKLWIAQSSHQKNEQFSINFSYKEKNKFKKKIRLTEKEPKYV